MKLNYKNLEKNVVTKPATHGGYYDTGMGCYMPDEPDMGTIEIDYTYEVDDAEVEEFLATQNLPELEYVSDVDDYIEQNFATLTDKYINLIHEYFEDNAREHAEMNYVYEDDTYDVDDDLLDRYDDDFSWRDDG